MSVKGENQLAKRNVVVLIFAQAILGSQMPMIFTVGGLAGQSSSLERLLCHPSYFNDCLGLHDYSLSSIKLNAKIWKNVWFFYRSNRWIYRRYHRSRRSGDWLFFHFSDWELFNGYLYVCAGFLPFAPQPIPQLKVLDPRLFHTLWLAD